MTSSIKVSVKLTILSVFVKILVFHSFALADLKLPPGFSLSLVADQINSPTAIEFSPDGRLFVSQKNGQIRLIKNGALISQPFLSLDVDTQGEHGLIGIAFDPSFFMNSFIYVCYVAKTPNIHLRVSRFIANGDIALPGSEKVIIDLDDRGSSIYHVSGDLHFGIDGKLYISSGDNAGFPFTDNAQRLTNTLGKILRINSDGTIPQDNPFISSTIGINQAIYAYGFRNPFSFSVQPVTGRIFANDVGQESWEEINELKKGANYGWPAKEGLGVSSGPDAVGSRNKNLKSQQHPTQNLEQPHKEFTRKSNQPPFTNPIFTYGHGAPTETTKGCAITGGGFYNPMIPQFPDSYGGTYFFIDYCNNWIRTFNPTTGAVSLFAENVSSSALFIKVGPDGSLYFLSQWFNSIYRISFSGSLSPEIIAQPLDEAISVGTPATFSVVASGENPIQYQWQSNQTNIPGATGPSYTLHTTTLEDNNKQLRCIISNSSGTIISKEAHLKVIDQAPPLVKIDSPIAGTQYNSGDTLYFGGSASNPLNLQLPASAYTWEVHFHHATHFHPFMPPTQGVMGGHFTIPTQGESSWNTWFRIFMTATDTQGLTSTQSIDIYPNLSIFNLNTSPPGLTVTLDGQPVTTPSQIKGVVGFIRNLGATSPQSFNGVNYEFSSWSDGLEATHSLRTSVSTKTFTAVFTRSGSTRQGSLSASPSPAQVCDGSNAGSTTLKWNSTGTTQVEIHINSPSGNILASSGPGVSSRTTQKWIGDGSTFYLQDVSNGLPLTQENTLATVTIHLTNYGCNALH